MKNEAAKFVLHLTTRSDFGPRKLPDLPRYEDRERRTTTKMERPSKGIEGVLA